MRLAIVLLLAFSCAHAETLICLGDSQTAVRAPVTDAQTYCARMAVATGRAHLNKGVGGNTTIHALERLNADVLQQPGSCVTVMLGANDAFIDPRYPYDYSSWWTAPKPSAVSLENFRAYLTQIVQQIRMAGKDVTLITPWSFWSSANLIQFVFYTDTVKAVGIAEGVPVLDADMIQRLLYWGSKENLYLGQPAPSMWDALEQDYQHPSAGGHAEIAKLCQKPQNAVACACQ